MTHLELSRTIKYFWLEKGDLARFSDWDDPATHAVIRAHFPEVVIAWDDYVVRRRILDAVVKALDD